MTTLAFFIGVLAGGTVGAIGTALVVVGSPRRPDAERIIELDESTDGATGRCFCSRCRRSVTLTDKWCPHCGSRLE